MKRFAIISVLLALAVLGVTLYGYAGAQLDVRAQEVRALPEAEFLPRFARLKRQMENGSVRGTVYQRALSGSAEDYVILEYTILVSNRGLVKAQMLEAVVVPIDADVLCLSQQEYGNQDVNASIEVRPGRQVALRCYLLTRKDAHAVREIQISYYIWGNPLFQKVRYG